MKTIHHGLNETGYYNTHTLVMQCSVLGFLAQAFYFSFEWSSYFGVPGRQETSLQRTESIVLLTFRIFVFTSSGLVIPSFNMQTIINKCIILFTGVSAWRFEREMEGFKQL